MLSEGFHAEFYTCYTAPVTSLSSNIRHAVLRFKLRQNQVHGPACPRDITVLDASLSRLAFLQTIILEAEHTSDLSVVASRFIQCHRKVQFRSCKISRRIVKDGPSQPPPDANDVLSRISIYWWSIRNTEAIWEDEYKQYVSTWWLVARMFIT